MKMIEIQQYKTAIDSFITNIIHALQESDDIHETLYESMKYVLESQSKRIRSSILMFVAIKLGCTYENALVAAAALELIHNYTIVHDDLPSMDNEKYRRGRLTCHEKFNEGIAVLTGNALLTLAYQVLTDGFKNEPEMFLQIIQVLLSSSGYCGVLSGQAQDILFKQNESVITLNENNVMAVLDMYYLKTGKLFEAAFLIPAILNHCTTLQQQLFAECGSVFGVLYQIADDIEDNEVVGDIVNEVKQSLIHRFDECINLLGNSEFSSLKDLANKL